MIESFNPPSVWSPFGAFSMGLIRGDGQVVYLKGQVSLDREGQIVGKGDMRAQTRKTLGTITAIAEIPRERFRRPANAEVARAAP